ERTPALLSSLCLWGEAGHSASHILVGTTLSTAKSFKAQYFSSIGRYLVAGKFAHARPSSNDLNCTPIAVVMTHFSSASTAWHSYATFLTKHLAFSSRHHTELF